MAKTECCCFTIYLPYTRGNIQHKLSKLNENASLPMSESSNEDQNKIRKKNNSTPKRKNTSVRRKLNAMYNPHECLCTAGFVSHKLWACFQKISSS